MPNVLVIGASGALGRTVVATTREFLPGAVVIGGSRTRSASGVPWRFVDLDDPASVRSAVTGTDLVLVAAGHRTAAVQEACLSARTHCVDVGMDPDLARAVARMDGRARAVGVLSVTMAGLIPGLSGLLVRHAVGDGAPPSHVELRLRQSANARGGPAGTADMLRLVTSRAGRGPRRERARRHPSEPSLRSMEHPEQAVLERWFPGVPAQYWTGWDDARITTGIALLERVGLLPRASSLVARAHRHDPSRPEHVSLSATVRRDGGVRSVTASAASDYGATAAVAVGLGALGLAGRTGAGVPGDLVTLDEVLATPAGARVRVHEGLPTST